MRTPKLLNPTTICPETWKAILWREWQRTQPVVFQILLVFIGLFTIVPLDPNGAILLGACLTSGQILAVAYGGGDVSEGSERYAFILPPRRADYFWSRYLFGLGIISALTAVAYLLNLLDLHRYFWGMFCETGLADTRPDHYPESPLGNFIFFTLLAYSNTYCFAASARRPAALVVSWFAGLLITFGLPTILFGLIQLIKDVNQQDNINGMPNILLSTVISGIVLSYISRAYIGKKTSADTPAHGISIWIISLLFLIAFILFNILF